MFGGTACGDDANQLPDSAHDAVPDESSAEVPGADADAESSAEIDAAVEAAPDAETLADADVAEGGEVVPPPDAGGPCTRDTECRVGEQWCEDGTCVDCDNSGLACRLACDEGWELYVRNGCHPCECAPVNACTADADCAPVGDVPGHCYSGWFCPFGCEDDASCCHGNWCDAAGCSENQPEGERNGCCVWPCGEGAGCTLADCAACDPQCVDGVWQIGSECGHCTTGGGEL